MSRMVDATNRDALSAAGGSQEGFARLYDRVAPALAAWARMRTSGVMRQHVEGDDLVQEIWWRALESFPHFDPTRGSFRSWIFGVAANTFRQLIRRSPGSRVLNSSDRSAALVELPSELQDQITSITADLARRDRVSELVEIVGELKDDDRRLFIHCGLEGMLLREVAPLLGISENAATKRWQRLRESLGSRRIIAEFIESS